MAKRVDGSYDFGDADMDNPVFRQRNAMADAVIRSGNSNPYPGFQSVGVTGPIKSSFGAMSNTGTTSFSASQSYKDTQPSIGGTFFLLFVGFELFIYFELGQPGFLFVNFFLVGCVVLRITRVSFKVSAAVIAVILLLFGSSYAYYKLTQEPRNRVQSEEYRHWAKAQALDYDRKMAEATRRGEAIGLASCNAYAAAHHGAKMPIQMPGQHPCP